MTEKIQSSTINHNGSLIWGKS